MSLPNIGNKLQNNHFFKQQCKKERKKVNKRERERERERD